MGQQQISQIRNSSDFDLVLPDGFSFFTPYLEHFANETIGVGGRVYVSRDLQGNVSGILIYDDLEHCGTIFTKARDVFDLFYGLTPRGLVFAELKTEQEHEIYDIYAMSLKNTQADHKFSHQISVADESQTDEIQQFMSLTHPQLNKSWVKIALQNGEKCLLVTLGNEIAGLGWVSLVNGIGRLHSLFVKPQFRKMGIGRDILQARLLWLKSKGAQTVFSEISRDNLPSSRVAMKAQMMVCGQIFQYIKKDPLKVRLGSESVAS